MRLKLNESFIYLSLLNLKAQKAYEKLLMIHQKYPHKRLKKFNQNLLKTQLNFSSPFH